MLELDWRMKAMIYGPSQSGQTAWEDRVQRDRELGSTQVAMQALSTMNHIMKCTAEVFKPNLKSSDINEAENSKADTWLFLSRRGDVTTFLWHRGEICSGSRVKNRVGNERSKLL
ncbi:hypothetical protein MBLNU13_g01907t1 [Cladosporium sp. NU13]